MKSIKNISIPFQRKSDNSVATIAVIGGIAVGAAIAALFFNKKGAQLRNGLIERVNHFFQKENVTEKTNKLGDIVRDVRDHVRESAEGLLGPENKRHDTSEIIVNSAPTKAWKDNPEKSVFPENKHPFD